VPKKALLDSTDGAVLAIERTAYGGHFLELTRRRANQPLHRLTSDAVADARWAPFLQ
jgi:hypothetical protein